MSKLLFKILHACCTAQLSTFTIPCRHQRGRFDRAYLQALQRVAGSVWLFEVRRDPSNIIRHLADLVQLDAFSSSLRCSAREKRECHSFHRNRGVWSCSQGQASLWSLEAGLRHVTRWGSFSSIPSLLTRWFRNRRWWQFARFGEHYKIL